MRSLFSPLAPTSASYWFWHTTTHSPSACLPVYVDVGPKHRTHLQQSDLLFPHKK